MTGGNRLRGLAETHVVGQEQAPPHEKPFKPLARASQRTDRVPAQRRTPGSQFALDFAATPTRADVFEYGDEMLAQAERVAEEVGALAAALERLDPTEQRTVWTCARPLAP